MAAGLEATLLHLGLEQYLPRFLDSGFGDWEALMRIAETQLSRLDVRLGHRRRLQRAIARERLNWPDDTPLPLGPDLNQRIQNWLREDSLSLVTDDSGTSAWPSQSSDTKPGVATSDFQNQSSAVNSSSHTVDSGTKVLSGLKIRGVSCLGVEDGSAGSKSSGTIEKIDPKDVERGVT